MSKMVVMTLADLHHRYDDLAAVVAWWRSVPSSMPLDDDLDTARRHVVAEARLLDDERYDDWLSDWAPDGILWVPLDPAAHPGADQSFFLDDVRRLRERVTWRRQSSAWSQHPPVRAVRSTTNVEARLGDDGALHVRSSLTIVEHARPAEPHLGRSPVPRARAGKRGRRPPSTHQGDLHPRAHCRSPAPGSGPVSDHVDFDDLIQPGRVHRRLYTDPAIFDLEMQHLFGGTWVFLLHESEVPAGGDFRQVRVGRRPVLVTRDSDGRVHALLNRCTHRGTTIEIAEQGCAKRFTCPYHGWTFANDGRLVSVAYPGNYVDLDRSTLDLGRFTVATYRGFVFGTLAEQPEPLDDMARRGDRLSRRARRTASRRTAARAAERAHARVPRQLETGVGQRRRRTARDIRAPLVQRARTAAATQTVLERDPASTPMVSKLLGRGHVVVDQRPGIPAGSWRTLRPLPFAEALEATLENASAATPTPSSTSPRGAWSTSACSRT